MVLICLILYNNKIKFVNSHIVIALIIADAQIYRNNKGVIRLRKRDFEVQDFVAESTIDMWFLDFSSFVNNVAFLDAVLCNTVILVQFLLNPSENNISQKYILSFFTINNTHVFYPTKVDTTYICKGLDPWKTRKQDCDMSTINFDILYTSKSYTP